MAQHQKVSIDAVAAEMNDRPAERLEVDAPNETLSEKLT